MIESRPPGVGDNVGAGGVYGVLYHVTIHQHIIIFNISYYLLLLYDMV